ncbi:MAG: hypothetical protein PHE79_05240 [Eubacteriales bacterium]|nr:hypothetical protein [Eubacteriales bacterium]
MYYCNDCKEKFEAPMHTVIIHTEVDTRQEEPASVCPICGSDDYEDMKQCVCGEWVRSFEDYCQNCIKERDKAIQEAVRRLVEFGTERKEVIKMLLDGLEEME